MTWTRERINDKLRKIQQSVPKVLRQFAVHEVKAYPAVQLVIEKALESPDISEEKKRQLRLIQDTGMFDKMRSVENRNITQQIDDYVTREIRKAVRKGELPTKAVMRKLKLDD